jgi:hypothetical protein
MKDAKMVEQCRFGIRSFGVFGLDAQRVSGLLRFWASLLTQPSATNRRAGTPFRVLLALVACRGGTGCTE